MPEPSPAKRGTEPTPVYASPQATLVLLIALVVSATLVAHWPVLSAQAYCFDDTAFLPDNPLVQNPSPASAWRFFEEILEPSTVRGYAIPLTMITFMLDYAAGGRPNDLRPFHRTNLLLHAASTALVIVLLYLLFGSPWVAGLVGLLFGLHPLTVEPIAWFSQRKTLLTSFFALWAVVFYVLHVGRGGWKCYTACLGAYVLSLLAKPASLPLPLVLLVLDFWPLNRLSRKCLVEKIPFFLLMPVFGAVAVISHAATSGVKLPDQTASLHVPFMVCSKLVFYLGKIVYPADLSPFYRAPLPYALSNSPVLVNVIVVIVVAAALAASLRATRALAAGAAFFLLTLSPMLGVVDYSWVYTFDNYAYLPMVGLLLPLAYYLTRLWRREPGRRSLRTWRVPVVVVPILLAGAEAHVIRSYLTCWTTSEALFRHMLLSAPDAPRLHYGLGNVLAGNRPQDAIQAYRRALDLKPDYADVHLNLATLLLRQGETEDAVTHYHQALRCNPRLAIAHYNLANALMRQGKIREAVESYKEALRLEPGFLDAQTNLAAALLTAGDLDEALRHCKETLQRRPDLLIARKNLALVLIRKGQIDEAIEVYRQAIRLHPRDADLYCRLGMLLDRQGKPDEALQAYRQALEIDPKHPVPRGS